MKKLLLALLIISFVFPVSCAEIGIESPSDASADNLSSQNKAESGEDSKTESKPEADSSMWNDSSATDDSSNEAVVDSSESSVVPEAPVTTTDDYSYAVSLSDEELACINAGADGEYMILVNKENKLPDDYVPEDLVDIRDTRKDRAPEKMNKTAEIALHAFLKEAAYHGFDDITVTSGYRTFAKQQSLYNNYVNNELAKGKDRESAIVAADKYSARPGTSEHHTGLAADMHNFPAASQNFGYTDAAKWLAANAHRFGFILRYPPDNDSEPTFNEVTTYIWEPWHFRFVGVHYATEIYESGLCLEEYIALHGDAEVEIG